MSEQCPNCERLLEEIEALHEELKYALQEARQAYTEGCSTQDNRDEW